MSYAGETYLFCGVGGSGMSALAVALLSKGARVYGSDRNYDRKLFPEHFQKLINGGVIMYPQDGSGVSSDLSAVVVSSAVENSIPDVRAAQQNNIPILKRAELLAELGNAAKSVTVGGTNGKSTVTGMIGWILSDCGLDPTILNGGGMLNFDRNNAVIGHSDRMVLETDESDGSITNFHADIAVLTNISEDHKDMDELISIFARYLSQSKAQVLNIDCPVVAKLAQGFPNAVTYSMDDMPDGLDLLVPGKHNISNALAAIAVAGMCHIDKAMSVESINKFKGITSRLEVVGKTKNNISVIDDFGHNPDKIGASLQTLKEKEGRLVLMYQPHGFGPTKRQKQALIDVFSLYLDRDDVLYMPEIYYAGGTADRTISSRDIIDALKAKGLSSYFFETKQDIEHEIIEKAKAGDTICIMGARDDSLRAMAHKLYKILRQ